MRFLGVDVGEVRIGTALSDPLCMFASPLEVIWRQRIDPIERLLELIRTHQVQRVVVGHPLRLSGEVGPAALRVEAFAKQLQPLCAAPLLLWDERLTTAQAERMMIGQNVQRRDRRLSIDKVAAALILQSYLDAQPRLPVADARFDSQDPRGCF
jgi:putative Holliday junction resolvase